MAHLIEPPWGDIIGVFATIGYIFFLIFLSKELSEHHSTRFGRKVLHMGIGFPGILVWFLYNTKIGAVIPPLFAIFFLIAAPKNLRKKYSEGDELHSSLVIYCISVAILTAVFWQDPVGNLIWIGAGSFITLAWGDGLGGTIGQRYGRHTYKLPWVKEKSLEGSIGVALGAAFGITIAQILFSGKMLPTHPQAIVVGAIMGMILEGLAPKHTDNAVVPLGLAAFLTLLYF